MNGAYNRADLGGSSRDSDETLSIIGEGFLRQGHPRRVSRN